MEYLLIIVVCLFFSAFFSGSETAMLRVRMEDLDAKDGDTTKLSNSAAKSLLDTPSKLLVTILFGNNVVNILGAASASTVAVLYFGEKAGVIVATVFMTAAVLIFSEIFPKAVASRAPLKVVHIVAVPLYLIHHATKPIHFLFDRFLDPFITSWVGSEKDSSEVNAYDSLLRLASQIRLNKPQLGPASIIQSTVRAQNLHAEDIMIPKTEIFALSKDTKVTDAMEEMLSNRFTRVPIYDGNMDSMVGLIHFKDLVEASRREDASIDQIIRPVLRVPEKKFILPLLSDMQKSSIHMAIVKDEFGSTHGVVTQEDILEELVGEIRDEFDSEELSAIHKVSENSYRALAKVSVRDFNRNSGWSVLAPESETIGGLIFNRLGKVPKIGDSIQVGEFTLKVIEMAGSRISSALISRQDPS